MALTEISNIQQIFRNAFRICGLHPFDANNVGYSKILQKEISLDNEQSKDLENPQIINHLRFLENHIEDTKLKCFHALRGGEWNGNIEDKSLYTIWYSIFKESGLSFPQEQNSEKNMQNNIVIELEEGLMLEEGWLNEVAMDWEGISQEETMQTEVTGDGINAENLTEDELKEDEYEKVKDNRCAVVVPKDMEIKEKINEKVNENECEIRENKQEEEINKNEENEGIKVKTKDIELRTDKSEKVKEHEFEATEITGEEFKRQTFNDVIENEYTKQVLGKTKDMETEEMESEKLRNNKLVVVEGCVAVLAEITNCSHKVNENVSPEPSGVQNPQEKALKVNVPSPFKRSLFWPENSPNQKASKRKKEKIPSVTTSMLGRSIILKSR